MNDSHHPLTSPAKNTGIPRPSKLPGPGSKLPRPGSILPPPRTIVQDNEPLASSESGASIATSTRRYGHQYSQTALGFSLASPTKTDAGLDTGPGAGRPPTPKRQPLQKLQRPSTNQTPSTSETGSIHQLGNIKATRHVSQQENALQYGANGGANRLPALSNQDPQAPVKQSKKSRPSLSDRAIETISSIPPSPASARRRSSFFSPPSPMTPRPTSSKAGARRPNTAQDGRLSPTKRPTSSFAYATPTRRSVSSAVPHVATPIDRGNATGRQTGPKKAAPNPPISGCRQQVKAARPKSVQVSKSRPTAREKADPVDQTVDEPLKLPATSAALREQIAKARALRRNLAQKPPSRQTDNADRGIRPSVSEDSLDAGHDDPFNVGMNKGNVILQRRIDSARRDGRLNISAMQLTAIPEEVMTMYNQEAMAASGLLWSEAVDLIRLIAADNEIEDISEEVFPDVDINAASADDEIRSHQFGGLETLDVHGNLLKALPMGLRRLERLTSLNLSRNGLDNRAFDVISQIPNLRDLQLANNDLTREVPQSIKLLQNLETLDLHGNKLSALPSSFVELFQLRSLDVSSNRISQLPMDVLGVLPLREIMAANNALTGALFDLSIESLPLLQTLDVSGNSLGFLSFNPNLKLSALMTLNASANRLSSLPDLSSWDSLVNLLLEGNALMSLPDGFTSLKCLKLANFVGNNLTQIDERIADMECLESLSISANPLRDRKFLNMDTEDLKRSLQNRRDQAKSSDGAAGATDVDSSTIQDWTLKGDGTLDLSSRSLMSLDTEVLHEFMSIQETAIRDIVLSHNKITAFPTASLELVGGTLTSLDLSHNALVQDIVISPLELAVLRKLNLSVNKLTSLDCVLANISAPKLTYIDISRNRLSGTLPPLRRSFLQLKDLMADDNGFSEAPAESLEGMQTVSLRSNDLIALDPRIGLLDGPDGLKLLEVRGNRFRVPSHMVLEKGTANVLGWLRLKLP